MESSRGIRSLGNTSKTAGPRLPSALAAGVVMGTKQ